jgi:hypothetical protein
MSPEEIEKAVCKIAWGGRFIEARDSEGVKHILIIKSLSTRQRNFVNFIYDDALNEARRDGVMTKFDLYAKYKAKGLWTAQDDEKIEKMQEQIEKLSKIARLAKGRDKKRFDKQIANMSKAYQKVTDKRHVLFSQSAEVYANEIKSLGLVFCSTYDDQENSLWTNWDSFMNSSDDILIGNVLVGLREIDTFTLPQIRKIARSGTWRFRWNGAKSIGDLFGKPISEFDAEQQSLLYWSQVYDSVYESMDRPPEDIINDDDALDKWFEDQSRKDKAKEVAEKGDIGKMKLSSKMRGAGEIFVVTNPNINPNAPSRETVDNLNTEFVRKFKQQEAEKIKEHGTMKETELRNRKNRIARKVIGSSDALISKNSFGQAKGGKNAGTVLPGGSIS